MDSNALRKPAAKAIFDEFIMPDLLARDHVSILLSNKYLKYGVNWNLGFKLRLMKL